jgi:hypothetical protein
MTNWRVSSISTRALARTLAERRSRVASAVRTPSFCTFSGGSTTVPGSAGASPS